MFYLFIYLFISMLFLLGNFIIIVLVTLLRKDGNNM